MMLRKSVTLALWCLIVCHTTSAQGTTASPDTSALSVCPLAEHIVTIQGSDTIPGEWGAEFVWLIDADGGWNTLDSAEQILITNVDSLDNRLIWGRVDTAGVTILSGFVSIDVFSPIAVSEGAGLSPASQESCDVLNLDSIHPMNLDLTGGSGSLWIEWFYKNETDTEWSDVPDVSATGAIFPNSEPGLWEYRYIIHDEICEGQFVEVLDTAFVMIYNELALSDGMFWASNGMDSIAVCQDGEDQLLVAPSLFGGSDSVEYTWQEFDEASDSWITLESDAEANLPVVIEIGYSERAFRYVIEDEVCGTSSIEGGQLVTFSELTPPSLELIIENALYPDLLCYGQSPGSIELSGLPDSAVTGSFTSNWFFGYQQEEWSSMPTNGSSLEVPGITGDWAVTLVVSSDEGCGSESSDTLNFAALPPVAPPIVGLADGLQSPFCWGDTSAIVQELVPATGGDGTFNLLWEVLEEGMGWIEATDLADELPALSLPYLTSNLQIRAQSFSQCDTVTSNIIEISVHDSLAVGNLTGDFEVCFGVSNEEQLASEGISGGDVASGYLYEWFALGLEELISTDEILVIPALTANQSFFLSVTNQCGVSRSDTVDVSPRPALTPGEVSTDLPDTLCYGFDILATHEGHSGGFGDYTLTWVVESEQVVDEQPWAESLLLQDVTAAHSIYMRVVDTYGCGEVHTDTIVIDVFPELTGPQIGWTEEEDGWVCYGSVPSSGTMSQVAVGGNQIFEYSWLISSNGVDWDVYQSGNLDCNLGPIFAETYLRLQAIAALGCGTVTSESLLVQSYEPFVGGTLGESQTICFDSAPAPLNIEGFSGGGDSYEFAWQASTDQTEWVNTSGSSETIEIGNLTEDSYYRAIVSTTEDCGVDTLNAVSIEVALPLTNPEIEITVGFEPELCIGESYQASLAASPTGGIGSFDFDWQVLYDSDVDWASIDGSIDQVDTFQPQSSGSLRYVSENSCGAVISNLLPFTVFELPEEVELIGPDEAVCPNSSDQFYELNPYSADMVYLWTLDSQVGLITSGETGPAILVDWFSSSSEAELSLNITDFNTTCEREQIFNLLFDDNIAPSVAEVVKKEGLNVLICSDSSDCIQYQWGAIDSATNQEFFFNDQWEQFIDLDQTVMGWSPGTLWYFVDTWYDCGDGPSCLTRSWYNYDPFLGAEDVTNGLDLIVPNPTRSSSWLQITSPESKQQLRILNFEGRVLREVNLEGTESEVRLPDLAPGIYIVQLIPVRSKIKNYRWVVQ